MAKAHEIAKRKTSFEIDTDKVDAAREILGTSTMTETVDAALEESSTTPR